MNFYNKKSLLSNIKSGFSIYSCEHKAKIKNLSSKKQHRHGVVFLI